MALCPGASTVKVLVQNWKNKVNERALRFFSNKKQMLYQKLLNRIGLLALNNQRLAKNCLYMF